MIELMRKHPQLGLPILLAAGMALTGCNNLNGTDKISVDDDSGTIDPGDVVGDPPSSPTMKCAYPTAGSPGVAPGNVVPVDRSWQGFLPGGTEYSDVSISDFYDCDGSRDIDAVMVDVSQYG